MTLPPGSFQFPAGFRTVNPVPVDYWSGPFTGSTLANAIASANQQIPVSARFRSMEVRIIVGSDTYKYWYYGGTANSDLVEFSPTVPQAGAEGPEGAIQFNDSGSFSGSDGLIYDSTARRLVLGSDALLQFGDGTTQGTARNFYSLTGATTSRYPRGISGAGNTGDRLLIATGPSADPFRSYVRFGNAWFQTGVVGIGQGLQGIQGTAGERGATGSFTGDYVSALNGLTGNLSITAGTNVSIGVSGSVITISASGGSAETTWGRTDPTTTTVGGVAAGTTFDVSTNAVQVLHRMLYPYQNAFFTNLTLGLPINMTVDLGTTSAAGTYQSTWGYTQENNWVSGSISISRVSPNPATLVSGLSIVNTPTNITHPSYRFTTPTTILFRIDGNQQQGFPPSLTVAPHNWRARIFYGKSAQETLDESYSSYGSFSSLFSGGISQIFTPFNETLATVSGTKIEFQSTETPQYLWLFSPNMLPTFRTYNYFVEASSPGFQQTPSITGDIVLTNINGVSSNYVFYRWEFPTVGSPTFTVNVI